MTNIFIAYARHDAGHRDRLLAHLAPLERRGQISVWHDGHIMPGSDVKATIQKHLAEADIVLLLISADFLASRFCTEVELAQAMARMEAGHTRVVPIILRACDWSHSPIAALQIVPRDGKPLSLTADADQAWAKVVGELRHLMSSDAPASRRELTIETEGSILDFDDVKRLRAETELRKTAKDPSLRVVRIRPGSVILELEMSEQAASLLMHLVESGELKSILGHRVRRIASGGRTVQSRQAEGTVLGSRTIKLLFLAANPVDTGRLSLDQEVRLISQHLKACRLGRQIQLIPRWAVQPDDIVQTMNEDEPDVVHFSGHGSKSGELSLMDRDGLSRPIDAATLRRIFDVFRQSVRLVVLNACYSSRQARVISQLVDCTIGMSKEISDGAAVTFSSSLYRGIGWGRSLKDAFEQGILSMCLEGFTQQQRIPKLHARKGIDPSNVRLLV